MDKKIEVTEKSKKTKAGKKKIPAFVIFGVIAVLIIGAIAAGVFVYLPYTNSYVATVDNEKIGVGEFNYYFYQQKTSMLTEAQKLNPSIDETTFWSTMIDDQTALEIAKNATLNGLRDLKVQLIKAKEAKITLTDTDLTAIDDDIQTNIIDAMGSGNKATADNALKSQYGVTIAEIRNMQIESYMIQKYRNEEMAKVDVKTSDIKTYYDKYPDWYEVSSMRTIGEEAVWASHILINAATDATQEVKDAAKVKAEGLLTQIKAGADFAELAKANSEDTGSAQYGGDYLFGKGQMVTEFEDAAFSLTTPGQVYATLVQTQYGYHIVKLLEKVAKDKAVSLDCATNYREYGITSIQYQLYIEKVNGWSKLAENTVKTNKKVYDSIN